ncbi:glycogen synthase GlgA [Ihubacter massiliensis]|uniref:Glycogen synthase n=1 Tax=Hominibacterium faecale TaxID=2839743 RepID=A0A9J6QP81_9FIRM|nr:MULTISPECIES: glycogen synthase GlgA [Eubacteriales Family XIII. Incertae Sedis]MCC2866159.1 glycogen synthase GlgA [Anaerovorax odorimutans]MCO7122976.1 glycogen synthase GlgA [Ihubacter massiliensis]MCU7377236.1 glycogen synthase GlgA [Hominibacterium faecale]MDE8731512.1 glycogen synthase GlgA [Eubacteriales bacterium DFI.9.88]
MTNKSNHSQKTSPIKVLYAIFEADPFIKTGGLGDVGGSLPAALCKTGVQVRVILPKLASIPQEFKSRMITITQFEVPLGWRRQYCGIQMLREKGVTYYFVDNEYYFKRSGPYGYEDDGERTAFFCKSVLECLQHLPDFFPDILHCNDWHTALIPVFLREQYMEAPKYTRLRTVFSVHNLKFQGIFPKSMLADVLGLAHSRSASDQLAFEGSINYLQGALYYSDRLTTVSPTYAKEIRTAYYGEHMEEIFRRRSSVLTGILNGIDQSKYSPAKDRCLYERYRPSSFQQGKAANKRALQEELGLKRDESIPLLVIISRLTEQKGLDLVLGILDELLCERVQLAVLGVGDAKYEDAFRGYQARMPQKVRACMTFDAPMSSKFYAAADILLMPSKFEPCGLSQMAAMRYGTIPIVRETGGLADSVIAYNQYEDTGDGFSFANYNAHELLFTIKSALDLYTNRRASWDALAVRAMKKNFSWKASAEKYAALYRDLIHL